MSPERPAARLPDDDAPPYTAAARIGVVRATLFVVAFGLAAGWPVGGYRPVGWVIGPVVLLSWFGEPLARVEHRVVTPVWKKLKPVLELLFGEWDQPAVSASTSQDQLEVASPEDPPGHPPGQAFPAEPARDGSDRVA